MNETTIENILFRAPCPAAPSGLLQKLQAEIALPGRKTSTEVREWRNPLRWRFPALAFGVLMLSCVIMIAVQANWSTSLKRQNEVLRTATIELPQLRERHAALENAQAEQDELVRLRKDNEELHQLQAEVRTLRSLPGEIQRLQSENQRLAAAPTSNANTTSGASFFDEAQAQAERIQCVNNLKQVGLAFRIWAGDNHNKYPTSLVVMSNELSTTKILVCPSDTARQTYASLGFGQFQDNMTSYQLTVQPDDGNLNYPQCIIAKCPIHRNYLLADGSVQQVNLKKPAYREVEKDGHLYLETISTEATFE